MADCEVNSCTEPPGAAKSSSYISSSTSAWKAERCGSLVLLLLAVAGSGPATAPPRLSSAWQATKYAMNGHWSVACAVQRPWRVSTAAGPTCCAACLAMALLPKREASLSTAGVCCMFSRPLAVHRKRASHAC
jgi:hypothetical protein